MTKDSRKSFAIYAEDNRITFKERLSDRFVGQAACGWKLAQLTLHNVHDTFHSPLVDCSGQLG